MTTQQIPKDDWKRFLNNLSRHGELETRDAEIEVLGLHLGDQIAAEWVPLYGLSYDGRSDTLEVDLQDHMHRIQHPERLYAELQGTELASILAIDSEGLQHIIRLRTPLSLPRLKSLVTTGLKTQRG